MANELISCIILTKNEEINIAKAIKSAFLITKKIYVVDSFSNDRTVEIAESCGARVLQHNFETHGKQFNWALSNIDIQTPWIIRLDADEVITPELGKEIKDECIKHLDDDVNGFVLKFKLFFLGKFLKHGGAYPFLKLVVFKRGLGKYDERGMRDQILLSEGKIITLKNDCLHYDSKSLEDWINKHVWYSFLEFRNLISNNENACGKRSSSSRKANFFRDKLYYKLPMFFRAKLYYYYLYIIKLGFLDGRPGKIHAFFQAYWYRYLIDSRLYERKHCK